MSATPLATLEQWLADAQLALHDLMIGNQASEVMTDGYLARFRGANPDKLRAYIAWLEAEIAGKRTVGGIGVIF